MMCEQETESGTEDRPGTTAFLGLGAGVALHGESPNEISSTLLVSAARNPVGSTSGRRPPLSRSRSSSGFLIEQKAPFRVE